MTTIESEKAESVNALLESEASISTMSVVAPRVEYSVQPGDRVPAHRRRQGAIDAWFDHMLRRFFGQKRAAWRGEAQDGHEFGWSAISVMGKLREEREGASHRTAHDIHYPEVYTEDALLVRRAIEGVDYDGYVVAHLQYMVSSSVKVKAREAGYSPAAYYIHLTEFHSWSRGRIELLDAELVSRQKKAV